MGRTTVTRSEKREIRIAYQEVADLPPLYSQAELRNTTTPTKQFIRSVTSPVISWDDKKTCKFLDAAGYELGDNSYDNTLIALEILKDAIGDNPESFLNA